MNDWLLILLIVSSFTLMMIVALVLSARIRAVEVRCDHALEMLARRVNQLSDQLARLEQRMTR